MIRIKKEQKVFEVQNNISNFVPDLVRGGRKETSEMMSTLRRKPV